ncbi:MAG: UDP-N-acetylmuramoyl-tripeptide--D-alanyl-D-alanine ligase [Clostridia bacterium]|nr:UDP-N-acetylmuramoyl-tripeptide--D-alanyl-D-alanine ligase [Clostridia bacterium]
MELPVIICMTLVCGIFTILASYKALNILQLESYRIRGFFRYLKRSVYDLISRYFAYAFFSFTSMLVYVMCLSGREYYDLIGYAFYLIISVVFVYAIAKEKKKTPLKFTARIKRIYLPITLLSFGLAFVSLFFTRNTILLYSLCGLLPLFVIPIVLISAVIVSPIEKAIAKKYLKSCEKKLEDYKTVSVGITGSYGKTTAKNILQKMLAQKFSVLASPKSFNTPMGLARTVNNDLEPNQIFVAEMGARYVGDVAELVDIIKPDYGVITSIGAQHLESFGSIDKVIQTKFEMAKVNKMLFLNGDDENIAKNADKFVAKDTVLSGANGGLVTYKDVSCCAEGVKFTLVMPDGEFEVNSKLLGEYVPSMVALCASVAHEMGVESALIAKAVGELEPVPHRLQLIKNDKAIVIDDAYNANPKGAEFALRALEKFDGTKIIITPGLVELGKLQEEYNEILGSKIAKVCDYALVVGVNSKALLKGIKKENTACKAQKFDFLSQAMAHYATLNIENPVVLFENDLPDNL